jgi:16S rRNA G966 N2-methylase RsmD|tara:strand:- start:6238 stop:7065 length:828 start_codon:yes stop_codon:yes gene_type:complete
MIERENLKFLKNIVDLQNNDINYRTLDDIVYCLKEDDQFGFMHSILSATNENVDYRLLDNVLQTVKKEPEIEQALLDSFSTPQVNAKFNIINHVNKLGILNEKSEVVIFAGWFGSIFVPALAPKVSKITLIDMDERIINVAKNRLFMDYENVEFIVGDIFETFKKEYENADLFINTSCEHMRPMSEWGPKGPRSLYADSPFGEPVTRKVPWWTRMKEGAHFAFQSNDMFNIDTHINCVNDIDEFKKQLPENTEVLVQDEINDERGTRFTLIGKIK